MSEISPKFVQIYGLVDPRNNELRYVGWAKYSIERRLDSHIQETEDLSVHTHKLHWLRKLLGLGLYPESFNVETVPFSDWEEAEIFWVAYFKSLGCRLTNMTRGGEGSLGCKPNLKTRAKMSKSQTGRKHSEESKRKMSKSQTGHKGWNKDIPMSKIAKQKSSKSLKSFWKGKDGSRKGIPHSIESRKKMSETHKERYANGAIGPMKGKIGWNKGLTTPEETKQKISKRMQEFYAAGNPGPNAGKKYSEEEKKKKSITMKKFYADRRAKANAC